MVGSASATPGWRPLGPNQRNGLARSDQTGSVSMAMPPVCSRKVMIDERWRHRRRERCVGRGAPLFSTRAGQRLEPAIEDLRSVGAEPCGRSD